MRRRKGRFRESPGLRGQDTDPRALALAAGFNRAGFADPSLLGAAAARAGALRDAGWYRGEGLAGMELEWILRPEEWAGTHTILVCAISCFEPDPEDLSSHSDPPDLQSPPDLSSPGDPHALIAPFARHNYYAAAARMMRGVVSRLSDESGLPRRLFRIFCNSRMPEKALMASSGIAGYGASGLLISKGLGTRFVIAGAVMPFPRGEFPREPENVRPPGTPSDPCGPCRACLDSCPVGAIVERGLVDPSVCLQGIASRPGQFPRRARGSWGSRLYGCEICQEACPHNRGLAELGRVTDGGLGPSVSIRHVLSMDEAELNILLKKTALGMSWISPQAILRNALVAAGNRADPSLLEAISRHLESRVLFVRDAAKWALEKCGSRNVHAPGAEAFRRGGPG